MNIRIVESFYLVTICIVLLIERFKCAKTTPELITFVCPGDGKWPDEKNCGKYYNCNGDSVIHSWCGPQMSFDADHQRCEMAVAIYCIDGDRPDWEPPENWVGKTRSTITTTRRSTSTRLTTSTSTKSVDALQENDVCGFTGFRADKESCSTYLYCKDSVSRKETCPERQLFDDELKMCRDHKTVHCGDRSMADKNKDQCKSKPNGVYPNLENGCSDFYQCSNGMKIKSGDCPQGLRFNSFTLRCDFPNNVPAPCGNNKLLVHSSGSESINSSKSKISLLIHIMFLVLNALISSMFLF